MAFSFSKLSPSGAVVYNTDYQVGVTGANFRPDVMLVQALLNLLYFTNDGEFFASDFSAHSFHPPMDATTLAVDGICGPRTRQLVVSYQERLQFVVPHYPADGHLDPVLWEGGGAARRGAGLALLGSSLRRSDVVNATAHYANVTRDLVYPPELRHALAYRKNTARIYTMAPRPQVLPFDP